VYTCTSKTLPTLTVNDVAVPEGQDGLTDAVFTVALSHAYHQPVQVRVRIRPGSASPNSDYVEADGQQTVTISPLALSVQVRVKIRGDVQLEGNETFFVELSGAKNAVIGDGSGTGTILNDDGTTFTSSTGGGSDR
jgi:hypothetical protein